MEVKKREVLFSLIIVLAMLASGFWISEIISDNIDLKLETYTTAVQIEDEEQFDYGMRTNFGNALVYGTFSANQPVTFGELGGEYLEATKTKQRYTMHTRTYTTTDSKGHTQTHTEIYWSWDYAGNETRRCESVNFLGHDFARSRFQFNNFESAHMPDGNYYNYESSSVRYYYSVIPATFDGTIHTDLISGDIGEQIQIFYGQRPADVVASKLDNKNIPIVMFWVVWVFLTACTVVAFVYHENRWLD